jgi:hypothetical protein
LVLSNNEKAEGKSESLNHNYNNKEPDIVYDFSNIVDERCCGINETQEVPILGVEQEDADSLEVPLGLHDRLERIEFHLFGVPDQLVQTQGRYHYVYADISNIDQTVETLEMSLAQVKEKQPLRDEDDKHSNRIEHKENQSAHFECV